MHQSVVVQIAPQMKAPLRSQQADFWLLQTLERSLNSQRIFKQASGTISAKMAIYADAGGAPGALLATSSEVSGIGASPAWIDFPISFTPSAYTYYWFAILSASEYVFYYIDLGVSNHFYAVRCSTYPSFPNPMSGAYPWRYTWQLSFYATYTSAVISGSGWA